MEKTIQEINEARSKSWVDRLSKENAAIIIMLGISDDGMVVVATDNSIEPQHLAMILTKLAKEINQQRTDVN